MNHNQINIWPDKERGRSSLNFGFSHFSKIWKTWNTLLSNKLRSVRDFQSNLNLDWIHNVIKFSSHIYASSRIYMLTFPFDSWLFPLMSTRIDINQCKLDDLCEKRQMKGQVHIYTYTSSMKYNFFFKFWNILNQFFNIKKIENV